MKVFAVIKENGKVILMTWVSQKSFLEQESWIDKKFINVCLSSDLDLFEDPFKEGWIKRSANEIAAHNILHLEYLKCRKNIQLRK